MSERTEFSPARWYRLKLYKMIPKISNSGEIYFFPRAEIPTINPSKSYIKKNENRPVVVFDANLPEDVTSS